MVQYGDHYDFPLTAKAVGTVVRNQLHLQTKFSGGRYYVHASEKDKIELLLKRYGL